MSENLDIPLVVDLDGTLVKTDTIIEAVVTMLKRDPLMFFVLPLWWLQGKAAFKRKVAERIDLDPLLLPYHHEFVEYLRDQHRRGRRIILASGSDLKFAQSVADHLGLFSEVHASDGVRNLSGDSKSKFLQKLFGSKKFEYAGNERHDLPVWTHAQRGIAVNIPKMTLVRARALTDMHSVFDDRPIMLLSVIKALRIHQWLKNFLLFVPLILAHELGNPLKIITAMEAFFAFSFAASAVYVLNDLTDLVADRAHPYKRHRPLAAGNVSIPLMILCALLLLFGSIRLALDLAPLFVISLAVYLVATTLYSFLLKQIALLDVLILAGLYTLRIVAGTVATDVDYSAWLLGFSMFLFLSLAMLKRYSELLLISGESAAGRGYVRTDQSLLLSLGTGSGLLSVLVLALYISSEQVTVLYQSPLLLWLTCPLILYWIGRLWLLAHRGKLHDDPLLFAATDPGSYVIGILAASILMIATAL